MECTGVCWQKEKNDGIKNVLKSVGIQWLSTEMMGTQ